MSWSTFLLQKPTVAPLFKSQQLLLYSRNFSPCSSQELATYPCPKPNTQTPDFLKIHFNISLPRMPRSAKRYFPFMSSDHSLVYISDLSVNAMNLFTAHIYMLYAAPMRLADSKLFTASYKS
jgi:hypothetical protein